MLKIYWLYAFPKGISQKVTQQEFKLTYFEAAV